MATVAQGRPRRAGRAGWPAMACLAMAIGQGLGQGMQAAHAGDGTPQDTVAVTGETLDRAILNGYRRYNAGCNHCHGPDGVGSSFGPSLIAVRLDADSFRDAVLTGRSSGMSVMKGYAGDPNVAPHVDDIYIYLRARLDGRVGRGRPQPQP